MVKQHLSDNVNPCLKSDLELRQQKTSRPSCYFNVQGKEFKMGYQKRELFKNTGHRLVTKNLKIKPVATKQCTQRDIENCMFDAIVSKGHQRHASRQESLEKNHQQIVSLSQLKSVDHYSYISIDSKSEIGDIFHESDRKIQDSNSKKNQSKLPAIKLRRFAQIHNSNRPSKGSLISSNQMTERKFYEDKRI